MLRCYEPAHIAGVSKTAYVPATPRCLQWRRDLQRPARTTPRRIRIRRIRVAGLLVVIAAIAAALGYQLPASSSSTASSPSTAGRHRPVRRRARAVSTVVRLARPAVPSPTARRSSMTRFRVSPSSIQRSSVPCAEPRPMPQTTASSSSSTAAGVPRSTRSNSSVRRSRSTAQKRKPPDGWPPPTRLLTCRGTRSTSGPPMPRRGCPSTAPRTGCARSTATNPGTTSCAPRPSITVALPCTPTRRTIQGCSSDQHDVEDCGRWPPLPWSP